MYGRPLVAAIHDITVATHLTTGDEDWPYFIMLLGLYWADRPATSLSLAERGVASPTDDGYSNSAHKSINQ